MARYISQQQVRFQHHETGEVVELTPGRARTIPDWLPKDELFAAAVKDGDIQNIDQDQDDPIDQIENPDYDPMKDPASSEPRRGRKRKATKNADLVEGDDAAPVGEKARLTSLPPPTTPVAPKPPVAPSSPVATPTPVVAPPVV